MSADIHQLKRALSLPSLLTKLGHEDRAKTKAKCLFHEDSRPSFSVYQNGGGKWYFKCFGCGAQGDEIDFVKKFFDLPTTKAAIERYAELAGMGRCQAWDAVKKFQGKVVPFSGGAHQSASSPSVGGAGVPFDSVVPAVSVAPAKLEPLSDKACIKIAEWRGLAPEFVAEMSDKGIIGLYDNKPAFSNGHGSVQYRLKDGTWRYAPSGSETELLVIGDGSSTFVVESQWDALALNESGCTQVICTRGASNAKLAVDYINSRYPHSGGVTIIPHNDEPGEKWLQDLKAGLMLHNLKVKRVPSEFKDFAQWYASKKGVKSP